MIRDAVALALLAVPGIAHAQAYRCSVPADLAPPHADLPSESQPRRLLPIGGYTLALTWAPQYCRDHRSDAGARFQCTAGNAFGFTLHGLWPDGVGKVWPQYCAATAILPTELIRRHVCATPSAQLLQHEWAKHGTCMPTTPAAYFERSNALYARLRYPDMMAASRRSLNVGQFRALLAKANPALPADAIRVTTNRAGWLDELWLCLDRSFAFARCPGDSGGAAARSRLKIWRGRR